MDSTQLADTLADPIGKIGMAYYFSPLAKERARAMGTNAYVLYAAGRGGVLGEATAVEVDDAFYFFKAGMIAAAVEKGHAVATPGEAAAAHLEVASEFARVHLASVGETTLRDFVDAARALADTLPTGRWPLVDGYLALRTVLDPDAEAYYWTIVLRELRCGVHLEATKAAGLTAAQSCQLDSFAGAFELHGYGDEDRSEVTDELRAARAAAEADTTARMAALLDVLTDAQRAALAQGAAALRTAIPEG